jgi:ubiquinone/menaquinone biosynthesis C-methylase UbiE
MTKDKNGVETAEINENASDIEFYTEQFSKYGSHVSSLGWSSVRTQEMRFEVLSSIGELDHATILDVGWGFGGLYQWLRKKVRCCNYIGIDITLETVNQAKKLSRKVQLHHGNIFDEDNFSDGQFDYVLASGIFTFRIQCGVEYIHQMVKKMFQLSKKGVGFNCLSTWGAKVELDELAINPIDLLALCREITPWVTMRHDYHSGDFSIFLYHEPVRF